MENVIKTTVFLSDMNNFGCHERAYMPPSLPEGQYPSRSAVEVARLPKDALVEIEVHRRKVSPAGPGCSSRSLQPSE